MWLVLLVILTTLSVFISWFLHGTILLLGITSLLWQIVLIVAVSVGLGTLGMFLIGKNDLGRISPGMSFTPILALASWVGFPLGIPTLFWLMGKFLGKNGTAGLYSLVITFALVVVITTLDSWRVRAKRRNQHNW